YGGIEARVLLEGHELVVVGRDTPGLTHPRLIIGAEFEIRSGLRDRISCRATRFERHEVEHRLNLNEAALVRRLRRFAASQNPPREACGPAGNNIFRCNPW